MQRSQFKFYSSLIITSLTAFTLVGCANAAPQSDNDAAQQTPEVADEPAAVSQSGLAEFSVGDAAYSAELQHCSLQSDNALFHGIAFDDSGTEVGYFDGDFGDLTGTPYGEARIDFGATKQFESTDEFVALGDAMSNFVVSAADDTTLIIVGGAWDQNGTQLSSATLRVNC